MFAVIKTVRACRSISQLVDLSESFVNSSMTGYHIGFKGVPNLRRPFEVRPKRLFSTGDNPNQDPLSDCDAIYPLNDVQIQELTGNDPQEIKKVRVLQMELAVKSVQHPGSMPQKITLEQWRNLLLLSRSGQTKYLITIMKKELRYLAKKVPDDIDDPADFDLAGLEHNIFDHRLFRNALFPMLHPNAMSAAMNSRLVDAINFSPTVVMDCGYEAIMTVREVKNLCQQLAACLNVNKSSRKPYNMVFCNLKKESLMGETLWAAVPNIYDDHVPIITSESCYTELYPKEKLVYLTPHCRETVQYNTDDIYIIGAMVDKSNPGPHSLIKAKAQGIRMGSFPIDKYLLWKQGTKSLTLNQVFTIMIQMAETGDWAKSFQVVPKRKILDVMAYRGFDKRQRQFNF